MISFCKADIPYGMYRSVEWNNTLQHSASHPGCKRWGTRNIFIEQYIFTWNATLEISAIIGCLFFIIK